MLPRGPRGSSLRALTTSTRHSTSTSPSTAPVDTPVSTYSLEEPSYALSYAKDRDKSIASLPISQRETRPTAVPTKEKTSSDSKIALGEVGRQKPSGSEEHRQSGSMREVDPTTKTGEGISGSSSVRASSDGQANATGEPKGMPPAPGDGDGLAQMSSGKGEGNGAIRAPVSDTPPLEVKVAETKARIEELKATWGTLDKERNQLTSRKEELQDEIARYVRIKKERAKLNLRTAPAQPGNSYTAPAPSKDTKDTEGTTSILSALFLLHSIVTFDTL